MTNKRFTILEKFLSLAILVVTLIFALREGCNRKQTNDLIIDIKSYKDSAQHYQVTINGLTKDVAYNKSLVLENESQLKAVTHKNSELAVLVDKYKSVSSASVIKTITKIVNDTIRLRDSIPCDFKEIKVKRDSANYFFAGTISPRFFSIDSLSIPNKQNVVVGKKKLGFLKGTEYRIEILNTNPIIKTTNIENYVIKEKKKWWQTQVTAFGLGVIGGIVLTTQLNK